VKNLISSTLKLLRQERLSKKLTQADLAEVLHVSPRTYRKIEAGEINLSLERFLVLCQHLKIDPIAMLEGQLVEFDEFHQQRINAGLEAAVSIMREEMHYLREQNLRLTELLAERDQKKEK